jgi:hypothetical protein
MEVSLDDGSDAINDGEYLRSTEWRPAGPEPAVRRGAARRSASSFILVSVVLERRIGALWSAENADGRAELRDLPGGAVFDGATVAPVIIQ